MSDWKTKEDEVCTYGLRWKSGKLQQAWNIYTVTESGGPLGEPVRLEWRDVPEEK